MLDGIRNNAQSWGVKIAFGIIIIVFVFWGIGSYQNNPSVVAKVNGAAISEQDFARLYNQQLEMVRANLPEMKEEDLKAMQFPYRVLESLIMQSLLIQEAERTGVDISPRELLNVVSTFPFAQNAEGKFDANIYITALKNAGQSPKAFEESLRRDMLDAKFRDLFAASAAVSEGQAKNLYDWQFEKRGADYIFFANNDYLDKTNPTDDDIRKLYEAQLGRYAVPPTISLDVLEVIPANVAHTDNISDELVKTEYDSNRDKYTVPERVQASHILLPLAESASQAEVDAVLATMKTIQERLTKGDEFGVLATEFSADTFSAEQKGSLGWFTRGQMVQTFEDVAFSLDINTVSEPVRTRFGYHLIKVDGKEEASMLKYEDVAENIRKDLALRQASTGLQDIVDALLVQVHSGTSLAEAGKSYNLEVKNTGIIPFEVLAEQFKIKPSDIQVLRNTPKDKIVDSALVAGEGFLIVQVKENLPQATKTLESVRDELLVQAKEQAAQKMAYTDAEKARASFTTAPQGPLTEKIKSIEPMGREGLIPGFGVNVELSQDLFASQAHSDWLSRPYLVDGGVMLAKPTEIITPDATLWQTQAPYIMQQLTVSRQDMLYSLYMQQLRENAEVKIINTALFQ